MSDYERLKKAIGEAHFACENDEEFEDIHLLMRVAFRLSTGINEEKRKVMEDDRQNTLEKIL